MDTELWIEDNGMVSAIQLIRGVVVGAVANSLKVFRSVSE